MTCKLTHAGLLVLPVTGITTLKKNASDEAMDTLRRRILSGELKDGSMLPGERELSEQLGVSRLTLRSALASLQAEGLIEKVHGAGNRVLPFRETGGIETVAHLARYAIQRGEVPLDLLNDIMEFRRFVAIQVLGTVTERGTPAELRGLRQQLDLLHDVVDDAPRFMEEDLQFARLLVRATHNLAMELLYNTALRVLRASPGFEAVFSVNARETLRVYERLLAMIGDRDPERVQALARRVLEPLDRKTTDRLAELAEVLGPTKAKAVKSAAIKKEKV
ncbi:MAG: DNA-binding FadR family transcriptional regulator [Polyangiales bacterium]